MSKTNLPIGSREYKLIIDVDWLPGDRGCVESLWKLVKGTMRQHGAELRDKQHEIQWRVVRYFDTTHRSLRAHGFTVRLRDREGDDDPVELTLRRRSPDRYAAATEGPAEQDDGKFEEDIAPPFRSVFSRSSKVRGSEKPPLRNMRELQEIFTDLEGLGISEEEPLTIVSGLVAHELFCKLGKFKTGKKKHDFKTSAAIWFPSRDDGGTPLIAELDFELESQFDDDDRLETFSAEALRVGNAVFAALQAEPNLVDVSFPSKTAWAFGLR